MDAEAALARVSAAVVAAFPDRQLAFLDAIERAFRMSVPLPPRAPCAFCGRGRLLFFPFHQPDPERPYAMPPAMADDRLVWNRYSVPENDPLTIACLDCVTLVREEFSANPPGELADRLLLDALRAVREVGGDDAGAAARALEAAFEGMPAPRLARNELVACGLCGQSRTCVRGPAGAAVCEPCSIGYWRGIAIDPLTGVENRSIFSFRLHGAIERARRLGHPLALLLLDIDWMKSFNDIHGHLFGDALLTRVRSVMPALEPEDAICRYGGEEFAMLLPRRTIAEAVVVAEGIRARASSSLRPPDLEVVEYELQRRDAAGRPHFLEGRISVSIGVAGLEPEGDAHGLVRAADERVQDAKNTGRNRVCA